MTGKIVINRCINCVIVDTFINRESVFPTFTDSFCCIKIRIIQETLWYLKELIFEVNRLDVLCKNSKASDFLNVTSLL